MLLSTFKAYFEGKKELFRGLAIEKLETEWKEHPVLHFSLNAELYDSRKALENMLERQLREWEKIYDTGGEGITYSGRFMTIIRRAAEITGRKVVVLIDEYDKPLLRNLHNEELQNEFRELLTAFYTVLKDADPWLRFVFITGVTKFAQLSMSGTLNNISNVSMLKPYAAICGITQGEMLEQMHEYIERLAVSQEMSKEETLQKLKEKYDGYHFTWPSPDIYNPFSLLNAFEDGKLNSYWFGSGTPTYLIEMLRKFKVSPSAIGMKKALSTSFDAPTERMTTIVPLLYQSGYITIKNYDKLTQLYTLDIPNGEIRVGLM